MIESTLSAIATCMFQVLPTRDDASSAETFTPAVEMVRKIEKLGQKSSRMALYTAAREYFETASAKEISASPAMDGSSATGIDFVSGGVETFSRAVVLQILEEAPIDRDGENVRLARIRMVLAFVRQTPPVSGRSSTASAARGKIHEILKAWRATERSRPLQTEIDDALLETKTNQQGL